MAKDTLNRKTQDIGNIVFMEHVNVTVPDQETATTAQRAAPALLKGSK